jgi:capsule polysaccharide modification protein KpsS
MLNKSRFKINLNNPDYMFEHTGGKVHYENYKNWNKLIKKIISI